MSRNATGEMDRQIMIYDPYINEKRHKVPIKMKTTNGKDVAFYTEFFRDPDTDRPVKKEFTVLAELYDWIQDQLGDQTEITWEPKIFIQVKGYANIYEPDEGKSYGSSQSLVSTNIEIKADVLDFGIGTDGRQWTRQQGKPKTISRFEKNIGYGLEKEKDYSWETPEQIAAKEGHPYSRAMIDDTPENRELLVTFAAKFDELRDQFYRAFAPEHVHKFLAYAAGTLLLNAPKDEELNGN